MLNNIILQKITIWKLLKYLVFFVNSRDEFQTFFFPRIHLLKRRVPKRTKLLNSFKTMVFFFFLQNTFKKWIIEQNPSLS